MTDLRTFENSETDSRASAPAARGGEDNALDAPTREPLASAQACQRANHNDTATTRVDLALDEGAAKATKRLAFEILRSAAGRSRALRRAANDMGMIRRAPILKRTFDALRAHAVICAPRTRAMREACETFVVVTDRRMRRSAF